MASKPVMFPCGHPRTPENEKLRGDGNGYKCRTCRQAIERRAQAKRRAAMKEKANV